MTNNPKENMTKFQKAMSLVRDHPMCAKFEQDDYRFLVIYPEGNYPDGCMVSKSMGKIKALERMLEVMERHWQEN